MVSYTAHCTKTKSSKPENLINPYIHCTECAAQLQRTLGGFTAVQQKAVKDFFELFAVQYLLFFSIYSSIFAVKDLLEYLQCASAGIPSQSGSASFSDMSDNDDDDDDADDDADDVIIDDDDKDDDDGDDDPQSILLPTLTSGVHTIIQGTYSHLSLGQTMPISNNFGQNTIFCTFMKILVKYRFFWRFYEMQIYYSMASLLHTHWVKLLLIDNFLQHLGC